MSGRCFRHCYRFIACTIGGVVLFQLLRLKIFERGSDKIIIMSATPRTRRDARLERKCTEVVERLVELNINFLAIDFDQTMIDIHTGGRWKESASELAGHVRPLFLRLIPLATAANVRVAVVTFSPQTDRIREVLEGAFPVGVAELMPIRGNDRTWRYEGNGMRTGKTEHVASAAEELAARPRLGVTDVGRNTTLLIDDDPKNIKKSLEDGTRAVWMNPKNPDRLLDDILKLK